MVSQTLGGAWKLFADGAEYPATVPGSVYNDLLRAGAIGDPYYRDNELAARELMRGDFEYSLNFKADAALLASGEVFLRCEGLDTLAEITLNGVKVAETNNMHRTWEFDVSAILAENNTLTVKFLSPLKFIADEYEKEPIFGSTDAMRGYPYLRKAHCMFGWDWGARLPDAGIWREISLIGGNRIKDVFVRQKHASNSVTLDISVEADEDYSVAVTDPDGAECGLVIENPQLWFPRNIGKQPLYTVRVKTASDVKELKIGLRALTVKRGKDEFGESFSFVCNGVEFFSMGADYIPEDGIVSRVTPERTRRLLEDAALANFNTIRVWGGGHYPSDAFYDVCDELGLIVWQDSMFACAAYRLDEEFDENIRAETIDNMRRLRNHPSLALWCGNNEMEWQVTHPGVHAKYRADYIKLFEYILPGLSKKYLPDTFYWPSSPSSGGAFDDPNDENRGDAHYWDVWHGGKPFIDYRKFFFRFASEFGFQSYPSVKTIETFTLPEDRNPFSRIMDKHQRNASANAKIVGYMGETYRYPMSFDTFVYASQLLQAEAVACCSEHLRSHRGRCMGAIYWQLNDCWPVMSWASIDWHGRWKALHHYAKRFFAPAAVFCEEKGFSGNPNPEDAVFEKSAVFYAVNETPEERRLTIKWSLRDNRANVLKSGEFEILSPAFSSVATERLEFPEADALTQYVSFALYGGGELIQSGSKIFTAPKYFEFINPELTLEVSGDEITVRAKTYAASVYISNKNDDLLLEDNFFDMDAGERRVKILRGEPAGLKAMSVADI